MDTDRYRFRAVILLIMVLLMGTMATCKSTAEEEIPTGLQFQIYEDSVRIVEYTGSEAALLIPGTIEGKPVRTIASSAFQGNKSLQVIILPEGLTSIGDSAFSGCTSLRSVNIPETVTSIGRFAFIYCRAC